MSCSAREIIRQRSIVKLMETLHHRVDDEQRVDQVIIFYDSGGASEGDSVLYS